MSSYKSRFLRVEHARAVELEHQLESTCHESQDRAAEVATVQAEEQHAVERATIVE